MTRILLPFSPASEGLLGKILALSELRPLSSRIAWSAEAWRGSQAKPEGKAGIQVPQSEGGGEDPEPQVESWAADAGIGSVNTLFPFRSSP